MDNTIDHDTTTSRIRVAMRIVLALFAKDALEAVKNKNTITVILTSLLLVLFYRALPGLSTEGEPPALLVYAEGLGSQTAGASSQLISQLQKNSNLSLYTYPNEAAMKQRLADGDTPELGLVIPSGFEQSLQAGDPPPLRGYVMRWVSAQDAETLRQLVEREISASLGQPVRLELSDRRLDLLPDSGGLSKMAAFSMAFVLIMIGVTLVPHLMLEEKQNHTLEALAVSPASAGQIVAGKALAGLFYCSLGGAAALAVNHVLVLHWGLAILTMLLGSLITVSLGLWLGIKIDSRAQLSLWAWVILLPLMMAVVFSLLNGQVPETLLRISKVMPSTAIFDLTRITFANPIPTGKTLLLLAWLGVASGLVLALVAFALRRRDREASSAGSPWRQSFSGQAAGRQLLFPIRNLLSPTHRPAGLPASQAISGEENDLRVPVRRGSLAMIAVIAAKDLLDALKNRLILSILLGSGFILLSGAALPALLTAGLPPRLVIYDEGYSALARSLADQDNFRVSLASSRAEMEAALFSSYDLVIGLVLPDGFDRQANSGQPLDLQAFYPYWAGSGQLSQQVNFFEEQLSAASGSPVHLEVTGNGVTPGGALNGRALMLLFNLVAVILVIGAALVPLLLIEEKEAQTLKVLLVSPASLVQVVIAKGLVGLFYSLLPALVILLFYHYLFVNIGVLILAVVLTATLTVTTGLLVGALADSPTSASMWGSLLLILVIGSALVELFPGVHLQPAMQTVLRWLPGPAIMELMRFSQAGALPAGVLWLDVITLLAAIAILAGMLAWRLRKIEA